MPPRPVPQTLAEMLLDMEQNETVVQAAVMQLQSGKFQSREEAVIHALWLKCRCYDELQQMYSEARTAANALEVRVQELEAENATVWEVVCTLKGK